MRAESTPLLLSKHVFTSPKGRLAPALSNWCSVQDWKVAASGASDAARFFSDRKIPVVGSGLRANRPEDRVRFGAEEGFADEGRAFLRAFGFALHRLTFEPRGEAFDKMDDRCASDLGRDVRRASTRTAVERSASRRSNLLPFRIESFAHRPHIGNMAGCFGRIRRPAPEGD